MRHKKMPDDGLKRLAVRRDVRRVHRRHDDAGSSLLRSVTTVATDNADHRCADRIGDLNRADEIRADIFFEVAAADREDEQAVLRIDTTALEPLGKNRRPAFIVRARGEFGNIVRRRVSLEAADFAEIIHGMTSIACAAADAEDEQTSAAITDGREFVGAFFNGRFVELRRDLLDLGEELFRKAHVFLDCSNASNSAKPAGDPIS